eukprot:g30994.t1
MDQERSRWWSRFRNQHTASGYMLQAAKVVGSEALGLSERFLKHREQGVKPRCDFSVTSIDTAVVDGHVLRGSLLLPKGLEGPFPSVLLRTPYGRKAEMGQSVLAKQGYAVLVQDTRGRFSSTTVAWMRQQSWCNGKVGVTGVSYLGFTAWACVDRANVDAIVPMITQSNIRSAVFRPGGADLGRDRWSFVRKLWQGIREEKLRKAFKSLPMGKVDEIILGSPNSFLQAGLSAHGDASSGFWEGKETSLHLPQEKLCNFEKPIPPCHILTGWYDFFLEGALEDFQMALRRGSHVSLTVGPTHHWSLLGFRQVFEKTMLSTFDEHLKGDLRWHGQSQEDPGQRPLSMVSASAEEHHDRRVHLYVLGLGWRHYRSYPPLTVMESWHLGSSFDLRRTSQEVNHSYFYNPARPTPAADQSKIEARPDVLVYSSAVLREPLLVVGPVHLELEATWQTEKADFVGRLCHVDVDTWDGRSTNLCEGLTSVTVRSGGEFERVEVSMGHTAVLFRPGERVRLQICSAAHPRWFRNLGTGEKLSEAQRLEAGTVKHPGFCPVASSCRSSLPVSGITWSFQRSPGQMLRSHGFELGGHRTAGSGRRLSPHIQRDAHKPEAAVDSGVDEELLCEVLRVLYDVVSSHPELKGPVERLRDLLLSAVHGTELKVLLGALRCLAVCPPSRYLQNGPQANAMERRLEMLACGGAPSWPPSR